MPEHLRNHRPNTEMSYDERLQRQCDDNNSRSGDLTGYNCPMCMNRGGSYVVSDGYVKFRVCDCQDMRDSIRRAKNSGLGNLLDLCTFDNFKDTDPWQRAIKDSALAFVHDETGSWFYIGGQVGAGKTHICTAIVGEMLKAGKSARYMLWRDEAVRLKAVVNNDVEYARLINPLKAVDVLYIDDFFKTARGADGRAKLPTDGDINVAFELINSRYNDLKKVTIISSEHTVDDILTFDEGLGSRIYQRTKAYCNLIAQGEGRNYRLKG